MGRRDPVVVGVATTPQVRRSGRPGVSFALEALRLALADCQMSVKDIGGWYARTDPWPAHPTANHYFDVANWATQLDIPIGWSTGALNAADSGAPALLDAALAISAGYVDTAAIVLGHAPSAPAAGPGVPGYTRAGYQFVEWTGSFTAVQFALVAQRHMHLYGTTEHQLAVASAAAHNYGACNPAALRFGSGPVGVDEVLASPMIAEPLTRLMCALVNDGGGALIVTTAERARDLDVRPVRVLGGADRLTYAAYAEPPVLAQDRWGASTTRWVDEGFARAGVTRQDVGVVELYDGFASWIVTQWELLGFCAEGEGGPFVESGAMALDGPHPTCTDGGNHAFGDNGRPSLYRIVEAVRQLRGEVDDLCGPAGHTYRPGTCRAARDPRVALAVTMGTPTDGGSFVLLGAG